MEAAIKSLLAALALIVLGAPAEAGNPYAEAAERDAALEAATSNAQSGNPHAARSDDESMQRDADGAQAGDGLGYQRHLDPRGYPDSRGRGCAQGFHRNSYGNCVYDQNHGFDQNRGGVGGDRVWVVTNGVGRWVTIPSTPNQPRNITSPTKIAAPPSKITAPPSHITAPSKIAAPPSDIRPPR